MFERKEGKVYSAEELAESSGALLAARHTEMRDAGKEITKLLSASNRVVKVREGCSGECELPSYVFELHVGSCRPCLYASCGHAASLNPSTHPRTRARRRARRRPRGATMSST